MTPVYQTKFGFPSGNCMAACAASILDISLNDVPDFTADYQIDMSKPEGERDREFWDAWFKWWLRCGYHCLVLTGDNLKINGWERREVLVGGKSPRGDFGHCVVGRVEDQKVEIIHDPHPDNTGVECVDDVTLLIPRWW